MKENETGDGKRSGRMPTRMLTDRERAESAFDSLHERGYSNGDINPIMSGDTRKKHFTGNAEETEIGNKVAERSGKGSAISGTFGAIAGVIAVIGTSLANFIS